MAFVMLHEMCGAPKLVVNGTTTTATCESCGASLAIKGDEHPDNFPWLVRIEQEMKRFGLTPDEIAVLTNTEDGPTDALAAVFRAHPELREFMERLFAANGGSEQSN